MLKDGKVYFQAGAEMVADFDAAREYEETVNKVRAHEGRGNPTPSMVPRTLNSPRVPKNLVDPFHLQLSPSAFRPRAHPSA